VCTAGWHNDSGFLTGLTPDIFLNHSTGKLLPANPEPDVAGLWVADRSGSAVKVTIPPDCMAIQCGECLQVTSGGKFVATPHCVKPPLRSPGIARACMPIFVDTEPQFVLKAPTTREAVLENTIKQRVPPLADRWVDGQTFADFLGTTFKAYYEWTVKNQSAAAANQAS
jgi:isopenicillin N synthase-like dioxygenase